MTSASSLLTLLSVPIREEEAIQLDGLNAAQIKELREKSEKHAFQAEVNRMMKLIINSLYKNKEVRATPGAGVAVFVGSPANYRYDLTGLGRERPQYVKMSVS